MVICAVRSHCSALAGLAHGTQDTVRRRSAYIGGVTELPGGAAAMTGATFDIDGGQQLVDG